MIDFMKLLGALFSASEVINGRLHIKLTLDIQDTQGNTIVLPAPTAPTTPTAR